MNVFIILFIKYNCTETMKVSAGGWGGGGVYLKIMIRFNVTFDSDWSMPLYVRLLTNRPRQLASLHHIHSPLTVPPSINTSHQPTLLLDPLWDNGGASVNYFGKLISTSMSLPIIFVINNMGIIAWTVTNKVGVNFFENAYFSRNNTKQYIWVKKKIREFS